MRRLLLPLFLLFAILAPAARGEDVSLLGGKGKDFGWRFDKGGEFPGAVGTFGLDETVKHDNRATLKMTADFTKGGGYVQALYTVPGLDVRKLTFRLKDPESEGLTFRIVDDASQLHQFKLKKPKADDWQDVVFPLEEFFGRKDTSAPFPNVTQYQHFGAPNDGRWRGPAKLLCILATKTETTTRTMWIGDVRIEKAAERTYASIPLDDFKDNKTGWEFMPGHELPGATGSLEIAKDSPTPGRSALKLAGDFTEGGGYVAALKELGRDFSRLRLRYKTDNVGLITVRLADATGQIHQRTRMRLTADGKWHDLVLKPYQIAGGERWGGANDGQYHGPAVWFSIAIPTYAKPETTHYELLLSDIALDVEPGLEKVPASMPAPADEEPLPITVLKANPDTLVSSPAWGFDITYRWKAKPLGKNYNAFVHIVDANGKTVLQDDHQPPTPTSKWTGDAEYKRQIFLPKWPPRGDRTGDEIGPGTYTIYAGLSDERGRKQLTLAEGVPADNLLRHKIATLTIDEKAPKPPLGPKTLDLTGYKVTFNEDFNDLSVSAWGPAGEGGTRWIAHTPFRGDFGDARFTDPTPTFPFTTKDGILTIEAKKDGPRWRAGLLASVDPKGNGFSQKYGYFEMRAKLPEGPGTWPAFWLNAQPRIAKPEDKTMPAIEIDVLEQYGHWPNKLCTAIHLWNRNNIKLSTHEGKNFLVPGMTEGFHTYGVMVTEEDIVFYHDGVELRRDKNTDAGRVPLYIMVNLTAGPGWPLDKMPNPSQMLVDYVRAYAK